jgi:hypothetical protein
MEIEPTVIPDYHVPLLERIKDSFVQTVPEGIAICEFDCDTNECSPREWKHCLRRLASRSGQEAAAQP